jgi:hypothetical protein
MANMFFHVTDESGKPLNGILFSGQYNSTPCSAIQTMAGCTSGPGNDLYSTTDSNGQIIFNIPYTCVGQWSGTFSSQGYEDWVLDKNTGLITGDVHWYFQMVADEKQAGTPAPSNKGANPYAGSAYNQATAATQSAALGAGKSVTGWLAFAESMWWFWIILAIIVVIIILALHHKSGGGGGGARTVNVGPSVGGG